ncbi:MAG: ABC transporter ATP-binding protein, partial [Saprospiraceae bacterium]|nr:ABC transporter ATP-binding protein [Saprospiraceae bacterium]
DDYNTEQVIALLKEQTALTNATLLIVTHDNRLKSIIEKQIEL